MSAQAVQTPREAIVETLYELFRRRGFEGVSIADISAATGLGRSSLYHHFPGGKAEMAEAVVALARDAMTREFFEPLSSSVGLRSRIDTMLAGIDRSFAAGDRPCIVASLLTADLDGPLANGLTTLFADWVAAIEETLVREGRARDIAHDKAVIALSLIQGGLVLSRGLRDRTAFTTAIAAARGVLISETDRLQG